jgi:hypothetical protein
MEHLFAVTDPHNDVQRGYLNFTIHDGDVKIPGRISSAAMRVLADDSGYSPTEIFIANRSKIRSAAYKARRFHPHMAIVLLSVNDFS